MDFNFTQEQLMVRDAVRKFCEKELAPIAEKIDTTGEFPMEVFHKAGELGFIGSVFPAKYGGSELDLVSRALSTEEMAKVCAGFCMSLGTSSLLFGNNIYKLGTEEQKEKYLPPVISGKKVGAWALTEPNAGSDALGIQTRAVKDGDNYIINGSKTFITNAPIADYFIVITRTGGEAGEIQGGTAFILERGMEGLSTGAKFEKMGMRCSPTGEVFLDNVRVGKEQMLGAEGMGFLGMMASLDVERAMAAFLSIGIAQACLDKSIQYAKERKQFKREICKFQLIQDKIARMTLEIDLARTYAIGVLSMIERGKRCTKEVALSKWFASEMATRVALDAIQIHGGYGYMKEYPLERYMRDAKLLEIGAGTTEIQKMIVAREIFFR
ncbi:MAG: acyl-CoA dehydrogenase family protein [bacterium]